MSAARRLAGGLSSLAFTLVLVELAVRLAAPTPRVQLLHEDKLDITVVNEVPTWKKDLATSQALRAEDCEASTHLVWSGDSIFWVVGENNSPSALDGDAQLRSVATGRIGEALGADVCLHNLSEPGFYPPQQRVILEQWGQQHPIDVLVVTVWKAEAVFVSAGDWWVDTARFEVDALGFPAWAPVPASLNRWMFSWSAAWRLASTALAPELKAPVSMASYRQMASWAMERNIPVAFVEMVQLDTPFERFPQARKPYFASLESWAVERGVPYVLAYDLLADEDVTAVRFDACWHFNVRGHRALSDSLIPWLRSWMGMQDEGEEGGRERAGTQE